MAEQEKPKKDKAKAEAKGKGKGKAEAEAKVEAEAKGKAKTAAKPEKIPARLQDFYRQECVPKMMQEFKYRSSMQVPRLQKIVINMGLGEAIQNIKLL